MTRYIVVMTIDRNKPGTDVTDIYDERTAQELVKFGYLEPVEPAAIAAVDAGKKGKHAANA